MFELGCCDAAATYLRIVASRPIAVLAFVYPVIALLLDYLLYGHALSPIQTIGVSLIVLGTLGVNLKWRWARPVPVEA